MEDLDMTVVALNACRIPEMLSPSFCNLPLSRSNHERPILSADTLVIDPEVLFGSLYNSPSVICLLMGSPATVPETSRSFLCKSPEESRLSIRSRLEYILQSEAQPLFSFSFPHPPFLILSQSSYNFEQLSGQTAVQAPVFI